MTPVRQPRWPERAEPAGPAAGRALQDPPRVREGAPERLRRRGHPRGGPGPPPRQRLSVLSLSGCWPDLLPDGLLRIPAFGASIPWRSLKKSSVLALTHPGEAPAVRRAPGSAARSPEHKIGEDPRSLEDSGDYRRRMPNGPSRPFASATLFRVPGTRRSHLPHLSPAQPITTASPTAPNPWLWHPMGSFR